MQPDKPGETPLPSPVDMSAGAVTARLQLASDLNELCLSLAEAGKALREGKEAGDKKAPTNRV